MGVDNHSVCSIPVMTVGGVVNTTVGPGIVILYQYACVSKGKSIHSSIQMERV